MLVNVNQNVESAAPNPIARKLWQQPQGEEMPSCEYEVVPPWHRLSTTC